MFDKIKSHAKINLALNITGKSKSLHKVESIIAFVTLHDEIYIKHTAHNRKGFALGAVLAAEFMKNKTGFYGMNDLLGL